MLKKVFSILFFVFLLLIGLCGTAMASDKYTATSTVNNITVNWEYELNDSNEIKNLVCKNPSNLSGSITIPSILDGKNVISLGNEAFKSANKVTEIKIPSTVKEIGLLAFSGCTNLSKVDLGKVEKINDQSFRNCKALTEIKIPKTLKEDASGAPFIGCENLTKIELEEGMTVIPNYLCAKTPITEIKIPSTVKKIGVLAFSGCTNLSKVDLGKIEKINDQSFRNCTALTKIKIPKTLKEDASGAPFIGCENLTKIELEEGMTVVPDYLCAKTPITEMKIPSTVKEIGLWAFSGCDSLKKITILDNVEEMEGYISSKSDYIFQNHNKDLTIYCYKDSMAAKYATKYNIKYVYLKKQTNNTNTSIDEKETKNTVKDKNVNKRTADTKSSSTKKTSTTDKTVAKDNIPQTGVNIAIMITSIAIVLSILLIAYKKYNKYKDIN